MQHDGAQEQQSCAARSRRYGNDRASVRAVLTRLHCWRNGQDNGLRYCLDCRQHCPPAWRRMAGSMAQDQRPGHRGRLHRPSMAQAGRVGVAGRLTCPACCAGWRTRMLYPLQILLHPDYRCASPAVIPTARRAGFHRHARRTRASRAAGSCPHSGVQNLDADRGPNHPAIGGRENWVILLSNAIPETAPVRAWHVSTRARPVTTRLTRHLTA